MSGALRRRALDPTAGHEVDAQRGASLSEHVSLLELSACAGRVALSRLVAPNPRRDHLFQKERWAVGLRKVLSRRSLSARTAACGRGRPCRASTADA